MNFDQVCAEVMQEFKRPDKAAAVRREVNAAITFYTSDHKWPQDLIEQSIAIDPQQFIQSFSLGLLTRFRAFGYLKRGGTKNFLTPLDEASMYKGMVNCDKYYIAGTNVSIAMMATGATLDVGYYTYPPILSGIQTHWMLDISPYMVIERALQILFRNIGDEKSMQVFALSARESYAAFRKDQLSAR